MVVTTKCIKLGQEWTKRLWMRALGNVMNHLSCISRYQLMICKRGYSQAYCSI